MSLYSKIISVFLFSSCTLCVSVAAEPPPKLLLLIAVDQLRGDRVSAELPGGLGRLAREGHVFTEATLDHGLTNTCPGHIVMSTGVSPGRAGIPGNSYTDHDTMAERYCVDDSNDAYGVPGTGENRSPRAIQVTTIGDWLKSASAGSKVFSVSAKDRAAITLGGHQADGAFWFSRDTGVFTTSGYYPALPDYVREFNGNDFFTDGYGAAFPAQWLHENDGERPDDFPGESRLHGSTSGHPLNQGTAEDRARQTYFSPFADMATAALARQVIESEKLGQRGVTDMLAVSFSATDTVGHLYGPYSAESADTLARLDRELELLLDYLDESLGGDYVLALSADHGVMPLPEWLEAQGEMNCPEEGGRIVVNDLGLGLYLRLYWNFTRPFGNPANLVGFSSAGVTVNRDYAEELGVTIDDVTAVMETYLEGLPMTAEAWTETEILSGDGDVARLYRNSHVPGKSAHLVVQTHENCLLHREDGTTHGSVHWYDRHVPLIFFGRDVVAGETAETAHSVDIAPTVADYLGLTAPAGLDGRVLDVFRQRTASEESASE